MQILFSYLYFGLALTAQPTITVYNENFTVVHNTVQLQSGTIIIENGCVLLTKKGEVISEFSRYFRKHFLPKKRLLLGQYTDALTDPFRGSGIVNQYECKK